MMMINNLFQQLSQQRAQKKRRKKNEKRNHQKMSNNNNEKILLQGITYGWVPIPEARELREARYLPGETVRAMQSPDGTFYVVRWRFSDFLAFFIIPLALITVPIGLFAMRLALV